MGIRCNISVEDPKKYVRRKDRRKPPVRYGGILMPPSSRPFEQLPLEQRLVFGKQGFTVKRNGEGGIRTHGDARRHTGFRDRLLKPLGHLSCI